MFVSRVIKSKKINSSQNILNLTCLINQQSIPAQAQTYCCLSLLTCFYGQCCALRVYPFVIGTANIQDIISKNYLKLFALGHKSLHLAERYPSLDNENILF